jgi:hypothetical protein
MSIGLGAAHESYMQYMRYGECVENKEKKDVETYLLDDCDENSVGKGNKKNIYFREKYDPERRVGHGSRGAPSQAVPSSSLYPHISFQGAARPVFGN